MQNLLKTIKPFADYGLYVAFTLALLSLLISLYFSDILLLTPCTLCWWGRILMYPLVAILGTSILRKDNAAFFYTIPFVILGTILGFYHSLLQWKIIPETAGTCVIGVPCNEATWLLFGFVTIPFLELLTFVAIGISVYAYHATRIKD